MSHSFIEQDQQSGGSTPAPDKPQSTNQQSDKQSNEQSNDQSQERSHPTSSMAEEVPKTEGSLSNESRPVERPKAPGRPGARGTAAMDPKTRQEVARKGGLAVSRNKQHMAEIGRKGGQTVSKNRDHMAAIGRKGGEASRKHR